MEKDPARYRAEEHHEMVIASGRVYIALRQRLAAARRAGESFDQAWGPAVRDLGPSDQRAVASTRADWQAGYNRTPPPPTSHPVSALFGGD